MEATTTEARVFETIKQKLAEVMPDVDVATVSASQSLADLGCNSLDRMDIVAMTMDELAVTVPVRDFKDVANIEDLIALFKRHL